MSVTLLCRRQRQEDCHMFEATLKKKPAERKDRGSTISSYLKLALKNKMQ